MIEAMEEGGERGERMEIAKVRRGQVAYRGGKGKEETGNGNGNGGKGEEAR